MDFLNDYVLYNQGNECPRNYHLWSALVVLAATMSRRVYIDWGYLDVHPNLYVTLVGRQGFRKSTAKDIARDMFVEVFPDAPIGSSVQSREDIVKFMASEECLRAYKDHEGLLVEYRPLTLFVNELKNFLSINPGAMIEFLTDIYDRKYFDSRTIKRGLEEIKNPCINILACETPAWITDKLKSNIISGGFSRRMIYIYELERSQRIPFPEVKIEYKDARARCCNHLRKLNPFPDNAIRGKFQWTPDAREFFADWYRNLTTPNDDIMEGYYESKHIQLLKISMLIALASYEPKLLIDKPILEVGIALLDSIEANMPRLSVAAGRNELAVPQQKAMEIIERGWNGEKGMIPEKEWLRVTSKDMSPIEQISSLRFLIDTEQVFRVQKVINGVNRTILINRQKMLDDQKGK